MMIGKNGFGYLNGNAGYFLKDKATTTTGIEPTTEVIKSTILAFARYILNNL
ncbi:hypothetical protein [Clostridium intestinale]|nr:hypothetical protein [Clostridium intestinale]QLY78453.1 hypothetical protein HZF06_15330 [Clostridium intestinale]